MTANKIAADAVVLAEDVAEEFTEQAAEVVTIVKSNPLILAGVAVVGIGIGGFAGYKFAERKLTTKYDQLLDKEIAETQEFYTSKKGFGPGGKFGTEPTEEQIDEAVELSELDKTIVKQVRAYHRSPVRPVEEEPSPVEKVRLQEADDMLLRVDPGEPHLISFEDFVNSTPESQQLKLTYYATDDILADEADNVVETISATVGIDNLDVIRNSVNIRTFYIRNTSSDLEFEIERVERGYAETVHPDLND